ncbi:MAG: hypothetical protein RLZZ458_3255 [Planctomycetota bacterium]
MQLAFCSEAVDQKSGNVSEEIAEDCRGRFGKVAFVDGLVHQQHPAITSGLIDLKRCVACAKCGVPAALQVVLGATETEGEEQAEPFFGTGEIFRGVHGSKQIIEGNAAIEGPGQLLDAVGPDELVEVIL